MISPAGKCGNSRVLAIALCIVIFLLAPYMYEASIIAPSPFPSLGGLGPYIRNVGQFAKGTFGLIRNTGTAGRLYMQKKKEGEESLNYSQYKFIEETASDWRKTVGLLVQSKLLHPNYFLWSKVVIPIMSPKNPWAWSAFPSTFDLPENRPIQRNALNKKRMQSVIFTLSELLKETVDDVPLNKRTARSNQIHLIEKVLKEKSTNRALETLSPWLTCTKPRHARKLDISGVPSAIVKQCCHSVGIDAYPDWPLVRRFNYGALANYVRQVGDRDRFLTKKGVNQLSTEDLVSACSERFMAVEGKSRQDLASDLQGWLHLSCTPLQSGGASGGASSSSSSSSSSSIVKPGYSKWRSSKGASDTAPLTPATPVTATSQKITNLHNKRFAMLTLNVVGSTRRSDFTSVCRATLLADIMGK